MAIFYQSLQIDKNAVRMDAFLKRYHFGEADRELLWGLWCVMTELLRADAAAVVDPEGKRAVCMVTLGERYDRLSELMEESGNLLMSFGMECFGLELLSAAYDLLDEYLQEQTGFVAEGREFPDVEQLSEKVQFSSDWAGETSETGNIAEVSHRLGMEWKNGMLHPQKSVLYTLSFGMAPHGEQGMNRENRDGSSEAGDELKGSGPMDCNCSDPDVERKPVGPEGAGHDCTVCDRKDCAFRSVSQPEDRQDQSPFCGRKMVYSYGISRIFGNG